MASWGLWAGWRGGGAWGYEKEKPPAEITYSPLLLPEQRLPLKHRPITTTSPEGLISHGPLPTQLPCLESSCCPREIAPKCG